MSTLLVGGALVLAITFGATNVRAQDSAPRAEARTHFNRGVVLAKQRSYAEALSEFQQAYAALPHFSVLYNIGQAQIALGQSAEAVATLQRYLDEGGASIDAKRRVEVESSLAREREKTPALAVAPAPTVTPAPVVRPAPAVAPAPVEPSPSVPAEPLVDIVKPVFPPPAVAPPPARVAKRAPKLGPARGQRARTKKVSPVDQRTLAYVVGATGLALTGGAVAHYWWNRGRYEEWQSKYAAYYRDPIEPNRRDANTLSDSIDRASAVTVVLAVGAGVALGTSGLLWVTSSPPSADKSARGFEPFFNVKGQF